MEIIKKLLAEKNRKALILLSVLLFLIGAFFTFRLFSNVKSDLESLLPTDSRSLRDIQISRVRFPSVDCQLFIVLSESPDSGERFVKDFVDRVNTSDKSVIARVIYNVGDDILFFLRNAPLYFPLSGLEELKEKLMPYKKPPNEELWKTRLISLRRKYSQYKLISEYKVFQDLLRMPQGNIASHDGKTRAVLIFHSEPMTDIKQAMKLDAHINKIIAELKPETYRGNLKFKSSGLANTLMNEYYSLWSDIVTSTILTFIPIALLLIVFYRTYKIIFPLCYVLVISTFITYSLSYFFLRQLNANTAFMSSIIVGNSINAGIILCSYFLNERKKNLTVQESLSNAIMISAKPTFIATLTSSLSFGSMLLSDSKGFLDFGFIGILGMLVSWACTYVFLPPLLSSEKLQLDAAFIQNYRVPMEKLWGKISSLIYRSGRPLAYACTGLVIAAVIYLLSSNYEYLERDTTKFRSKEYLNTNFIAFQKHIEDISLKPEYFPSLLILTNNLDDVQKLQTRIQTDTKLKKMVPDIKTFAIQNVIPEDQEEKLKVIREIKQYFNKNKSHIKNVKLTLAQLTLLHSIVNTDIKNKIEIPGLPEQTRAYFTELDGSTGKMLFISVDLNRLEHDLFLMISFIKRLNEVSDSAVGRNNYICTGIIPITTELAEILLADSTRCVAFSLLSVLIVFLIFYRGVRLFSLMTLYFCYTMIIFFVLIPILGIKINFLNFIAVPLTFGIGIDYSSNIIQNVLIQGDGKDTMKNTLFTTGPFIMVGSLTTIIGYSSLLFTNTLALTSFGSLCLQGELVTITSALVILPALFSVFYAKSRK